MKNKLLISLIACLCISNNTIFAQKTGTKTPPKKNSTTTQKSTKPKSSTSTAVIDPDSRTVTVHTKNSDGSTSNTTITVKEKQKSKPASTASKNKSKNKNDNLDKAFGGKGSSTFSLGIGANNVFTFYPKNGRGLKYWSSPIYGAINLEGEFGVHKYVGVGITSSISASANLDGLFHSSILAGLANEPAKNWGIAIPIGVIANFHFYQLIQDKVRKNIHGDKLDLYVGANLGAGPGISFPRKKVNPNGQSDFGFVIFGGFQAGIKYYVKPKTAIYLELGWGKAIINAGVCFKMKKN